MRNYDHDLAIAVEEDYAAAEAAWKAELARLIETDTCRKCKQAPAVTEYTEGFRICSKCSRWMSQ